MAAARAADHVIGWMDGMVQTRAVFWGLWRRLRMEVRGEAGEGVGGRDEAVTGAGGGGFELRSGEDAQGADVTGREMLLDSLLLGGWEFAVDVSADLVANEVFGG